MTTKIEWAEETWNPITGCSKVSEGCANCYAERFARRLAGRYGYPEIPHHFDVTLHPGRLEEPSHWKKPRRIFVCSMGDLFHERLHWSVIEAVFMTMVRARKHTFLVLTKRAAQMYEFVSECFPDLAECSPHIWLGVTAENQQRADERIPLLLQTPAAVRFVSCEPLLGPIDLDEWLNSGISWCIVGAESGPHARHMDEDHARRLITQCRIYKTPIFYKQNVIKGKKISLPAMDGRQYVEFPQPNAGLFHW